MNPNQRERHEEEYVQEGREWEETASPSPRVWRGPVTLGGFWHPWPPIRIWLLPRSSYKATQPNKYPSWGLDWAFLHPNSPITLFFARLVF